jgi:branched-chain amino acid transport system permease protein
VSEVYLQLLVNGIALGAIYVMLSLGINLIYGVLGVIDFSQGEALMLGMYATYGVHRVTQLDPFLCIPIIMPVAFIYGYLIQRGIISPILNKPELSQVFTTLGVSIILQNLALILWKADYRTIDLPYSGAIITIGPVLLDFPRLVCLGISLMLASILFIFLKWTNLGMAIRAVSQNLKAANLMGVNSRGIYPLTFGLGIVCVSIAAASLVTIYPSYPSVGTHFILIMFVVISLGGLGSMPGVLVGGFLVGIIESFSGWFISPDLKELVYFVIFILILTFRPEGIFGTTIRHS